MKKPSALILVSCLLAATNTCSATEPKTELKIDIKTEQKSEPKTDKNSAENSSRAEKHKSTETKQKESKQKEVTTVQTSDFDEGLNALLDSDYHKAIFHLEALVKRSPRDGGARAALAAAYNNLGLFESDKTLGEDFLYRAYCVAPAESLPILNLRAKLKADGLNLDSFDDRIARAKALRQEKKLHMAYAEVSQALWLKEDEEAEKLLTEIIKQAQASKEGSDWLVALALDPYKPFHPFGHSSVRADETTNNFGGELDFEPYMWRVTEAISHEARANPDFRGEFAEVLITVDKNGQITKCEVKDSSQDQKFNEFAIDTIKKAHLPKPPTGSPERTEISFMVESGGRGRSLKNARNGTPAPSHDSLGAYNPFSVTDTLAKCTEERRQGNYDQALAELKEAMTHISAQRGQAYLMAQALEQEAEIAYLLGDLKSSEKCMKDALAIHEKVLHTSDLSMTRLLERMLRLLYRTGRKEEAATYNLRIKEAFENISKSDSN